MKPVMLVVAAAAAGLAASRPVAPVAAAAPTVSLSARHAFVMQDDAKAMYSELCKKCHGVLGNPPQTMKKKYAKIVSFDQKFLDSHSEDSIVTILTKGKGEDMESIKDKASKEQMKALAKYVRELAAKPKPGGD